MKTQAPYRAIKIISTWIFIILLIGSSYAQVEERKVKWTIKGYLKDMPYISFDKSFSNRSATNLIHNRTNIKWNPHEKLSGAAEFRTRLFWGDDVRAIPNFAEQLRNKNERIHASIIWFENRNSTMVTNVERFWLEYKTSNYLLCAGRQRINWGIATMWNPNDIFNTYNFLDFDYEERPGSDAIKAQYFISELSNMEVAVSPSLSNHSTVAAAKYFFNRATYDWQFNVGMYHHDLTAGAGWAGSIGDVGFKGEMQYFTSVNQTASQFNVVMEWDYMFNSGWYINSGLLWNNRGLSKPVNDWTKVSFNLSPRNLMPTQYNVLLSTTKEITPLLSASLGLIYTPGTHIAILLPSFQYNVSDHWDVNLVWQSFYADMNNSFEAITHRIFIRAKWSF